MEERSRESLGSQLRSKLGQCDGTKSTDAPAIVEAILSAASDTGASDVHLLPFESHLAMLWRIDGVLHPVWDFPATIAPNIVARLKVLAELLTYRTDVPQEGRIRDQDVPVEMRVSTFPTLHGEKAVVRLFVGSGRYRELDDLGLPVEYRDQLNDLLLESGGVLLVVGPAGSGKTTTIYACLRELVNKFATQRSLVSVEDPIEAVIPGVAQSQINVTAGFDYQTGLKSLMRQDPEVITVGEIRDRETAEIVFQASLTGHLVLTTFHAGSAAGAISRLSDMGIEPYLLRSGILGILCQRLVRRLCDCAKPCSSVDEFLGLHVKQACVPVGCPACGRTGYNGRLVIAEFLTPDLKNTGRAILSRGDTQEIEQLAMDAGMVSRWERACEAVSQGRTSPAEVRRVLGVSGG